MPQRYGNRRTAQVGELSKVMAISRCQKSDAWNHRMEWESKIWDNPKWNTQENLACFQRSANWLQTPWPMSKIRHAWSQRFVTLRPMTNKLIHSKKCWPIVQGDISLEPMVFILGQVFKSPDFIAKIHGILESKLVCWRIPRILCKKHLDLDIFLDVPAPKWNPSEFLRLIIICSIRKCQRFPTPSEKKMCFHIRISFPSVSSVHSQYHPYFIISIFYKPFTRTLHKNRHNLAMFSPCFPWPWRWWARLQTALFFPGFAPCGPPDKGDERGHGRDVGIIWGPV